MVDQGTKIAIMAALTEARATLAVASKQVGEIEADVWRMFGMDTGVWNSSIYTIPSEQTEGERRAFAVSKRRRTDSASTCVLGEHVKEEVKVKEEMKEEVKDHVKEEAQPVVPDDQLPADSQGPTVPGFPDTLVAPN